MPAGVEFPGCDDPKALFAGDNGLFFWFVHAFTDFEYFFGKRPVLSFVINSIFKPDNLRFFAVVGYSKNKPQISAGFYMRREHFKIFKPYFFACKSIQGKYGNISLLE